MASNDSDRIGFLSAGGVLSIVAGAFEVNGGGIMLASAKLGVQFRLWDFALYPGIWLEHIIPVDSPWFIIMGGTSCCSGYNSHSRWLLGHKKEKFWPVFSRGYLCPSLSAFGDTDSYFCRPEEERIWCGEERKWRLMVVTGSGYLELVES